MYKLLLCWRYLRTRYIALACIVSVTLGVATMIVVNSVMAGFTVEMQDRIHNILSDVVVESYSTAGFYDPDRHMQRIEEVAGEYIEEMTPTVTVPGMLSFSYGGKWVTRHVTVVGIPADGQKLAAAVTQYLVHPENREELSFLLRDGGYDTHDHQAKSDKETRPMLRDAGWPHRQRVAEFRAEALRMKSLQTPVRTEEETHDLDGEEIEQTDESTAQENSAKPNAKSKDPFAQHQKDQGPKFDPKTQQRPGLILGIGLTMYHDPRYGERFLVVPGDDLTLTFPNSGTPPKAIEDVFTVVDLYESKMSEYDANLVFVPIERLQQDRGMIDPETKVTFVSSIQIKLKDDANGSLVRDLLRDEFPADVYSISTWRDKQGPLLAAVQLETAILNVLLFLIIGVAGFGILAIFFMIVVEKTKDIGILKSLGASGSGVMGVFLGYGMFLGLVGAGAGLILGLVFSWNINSIAQLLGKITGHEVFDPSIYYFYSIPTIFRPITIAWIVGGALGIAVLASVFPARRAALMRPVEALRYE